MKPPNPLINSDGFTVVELILVLVILGLLAGVALPRFIDLDTSTTDRAIGSVIAELNGRENLAWSGVKISVGGYTDDATLQDQVNYDLGSDFSWTDFPWETGAKLKFRDMNYTLIRTPSDELRPGIWSR